MTPLGSACSANVSMFAGVIDYFLCKRLSRLTWPGALPGRDSESALAAGRTRGEDCYFIKDYTI